MYTYSQTGDKSLDAEQVSQMLDGQFGVQRVNLALRALDRDGFLTSYSVMGSGQKFAISESGYLEVESSILARVNQIDYEASANPLDSIERELAPASGRMVTFGDNQSAHEQAIVCIEQATETIRRSNIMSEADKSEAVISLDSWKGLIQSARSFAIGAFRYLVWDRIKAVIEGSIEDTYRLVLTGLLITLGTIVVSLL